MLRLFHIVRSDEESLRKTESEKWKDGVLTARGTELQFSGVPDLEELLTNAEMIIRDLFLRLFVLIFKKRRK